MKTRDSLKDSSRISDLKYGKEIIVELLDEEGVVTRELDVLGWLSCNPQATYIVIADPFDLPVGEYRVRARMLNSPEVRWPSSTIVVPFERDGLAECYIYEGRLGYFRPHEIENYTG